MTMLDRMKPLRDPSKQHVYRCHQCGWRWTSTLAHPPERCPNCHSRNWDTPHRRPRGRPRKADTPPAPPAKADRSDRFGWQEGDITLTGPDGAPLADEEEDV
jgi:hypothetical protein